MKVAAHDIDLTIIHIPGKQKEVADLLFRWQSTAQNDNMLKGYLKN